MKRNHPFISKFLNFYIAVAAMMVLTATKVMGQQAVAHFDMSLTADGKVTEQVTGQQFAVSSQLTPCTVAGLDGQALRLDGYSNYVKATVPTATFSTEALTLSVVLAAETYPMMQVDVAETTPTYTAICGNLDEDGKKGIALELSSQGDVRLRYGSASGFMMTVEGDTKLPRGQWCQLTATLDKAANAATLYLNGTQIGTGRMSRQAISHSTADFLIGKSAQDVKSGPFLINTFCGLIDDIAVYNTTLTPPEGGMTGLARPDFSYPASRYELPSLGGVGGGLWRPQFHGMPSGGWTNETHGMAYSDGRYHVFFQKNANGPYMSRLHWGHISSENLYQWREEPIAVYPAESFDLKGCWSGCVYEDGADTYILYTAVDNQKARIAQTRATDATLADWTDKRVIIDGRPAGLSDDFRDPYYFEANGQKYIIVGTSKNGIGACTLHKLQNGTWTNDGTIFFQGGNQNQHGTFWEMPNVTLLTPPEGGKPGKWLFTCTPLGTGVGVRTLCWVGTIGTDGKFTPVSPQEGPQYLEMNGISRDGYGLLSPTLLPLGEAGRGALLLGIVPDKLPTDVNYQMGWAHNYSLPRELSLDANDQLVQKPYSGLTAMRTTTTVAKTLTGAATESLSPVSGRQLELLAEVAVTTGQCGFRFLKSGDRQASLTYDADQKMLTLDLTALSRQVNDGGSYGGVYAVSVPEALTKLDVWLDGSILDIFVNDRWAYSVRVFPTDANAVETEVFSTATGTVKAAAWTLDATQQGSSGIKEIVNGKSVNSKCYDLLGRRLTTVPTHGLYIADGRKIVK